MRHHSPSPAWPCWPPDCPCRAGTRRRDCQGKPVTISDSDGGTVDGDRRRRRHPRVGGRRCPSSGGDGDDTVCLTRAAYVFAGTGHDSV